MNRIRQPVSIVERFLTVESIDLLRLLDSLRFAPRLLRSPSQAVLLHTLRPIDDLFRGNHHLVLFGFHLIRHI